MPSATESKLGGHRISVQHAPKRLLQRVEPRLVMLPLLHPLAKNGPTHLFGAGRANSPLIFMESQYAFLERKAAVREQPAHLAFGVLDHPLVEHAVHAAR